MILHSWSFATFLFPAEQQRNYIIYALKCFRITVFTKNTIQLSANAFCYLAA